MAERVFDVWRATDSNSAGNTYYGGEHAMGTGGKSRVGSYPLMLSLLTSTFLLCFIVS